MLNTYEDYLKLSAFELIDRLSLLYTEPLPEKIDSLDEMEKAGSMLAELTNHWVFLNTLDSYAKAKSRIMKRAVNKEDASTKESSEDMIDKCYVIQKMTESVKQRYTALSRMIAVKQEMNKELFMSETRSAGGWYDA